MSELLTRSFQIRSTDLDERTVTGIAVPWDSPVKIRDWWVGETYYEQIARGAVTESDEAKLYAEHRDIIGKITSHRDTDEGWEVTARISETSRGNDVYALLRDGALDRFSIGFEPIEHVESRDADDVLTITRTKVRVREVSVVPFPAYDGAKVQQVRSAQTDKEHHPMPETATTDLTEIRESITDLDRTVQVINARTATMSEPAAPIDTRSAGELLKAMVMDGDDSAVRAYNDTIERAYDGGTTADTIMKNGWVGDLTRLIDEAAGVRALFATGNLPKEGNFLEYGKLDTNTAAVAEQAAEGDDLVQGKVTVKTETAPVKTFGGFTRLTRQQIERSSVNILDTNLRAQAIAAGKALNTYFRAKYAAAVTAQRTANNTVDVPTTDATYEDWLDAVVDAAIKFEDFGLSLDTLVVDPTYFKAFNRFKGNDGRPLFTVSGTGANTVGSLDVKTLKGDLASIPVRLNAKQTTPGGAFINANALRTYASPVVRLQDENIINLSKDFAVYFYAAIADEVPNGIVPVKRTA